MTEVYKGVCFIIPGIAIYSRRRKQLLFIQDILHNDFDPSPLPQSHHTPKTWHTFLKKQAKEWDQNSKIEDAYAIRTVCNLRCVQLEVDWEKTNLEKKEIFATIHFNREVPSTR